MLNPIDYSISKFVSFIDEKTLAEFHSRAETLHFKKGDIIETRGDPVDHIYLIEKGLVQIGINREDGSRFNLARLGSGHTFGEAAYFLKACVSHDAHAESDVILQKISGSNIDQLMGQSLLFSKALMAVACLRVDATLSHIGDKLAMPLEARTAKQILSVSDSVDKAGIISLRQIDLAHALGISRVSIGKALKELARQNLIKIGYGKLEILSRQGLSECVRRAERY